MEDVEQTIISQYANSNIIVQLIQDMNDCIDPDTDFDTFYDYVWNLNTAQGFGLDIWGRILGISRNIKIPNSGQFFGFDDSALDWQPFNQAPFFLRNQGFGPDSTFTLADGPYRTLLFVKALSNISDSTARTYNTLLQNLFRGRGVCYVADLGGMMMQYRFYFVLAPFEVAILTTSGALSHPAGVGVSIAIIPPSGIGGYLGWAEAGDASTFGSGVWYVGPGGGLRTRVHTHS